MINNIKFLIILAVILSSACTSIIPYTKPKATYIEPNSIIKNDQTGWHAARFKVNWQKQQDPDWFIGTLIAGEVIAPLMKQYEDKIKFWRIHRRAADDETGHIFSFIFYSSNQDAVAIYKYLQSQTLLKQLQQNKLLFKVNYDAITNPVKSAVADTSDPNWPVHIQKTWPVFMMGASKMWLDLVIALKTDIKYVNTTNLVSQYKLIQEQITNLWQQQGQHVMFHHLNALYAYQPVLTRY